MCIATDKEVGASDRRRREMRPGRVYMMEFKVIFVKGYNNSSRKDNGWKQLDLKKWGFRKRFRKQ